MIAMIIVTGAITISIGAAMTGAALMMLGAMNKAMIGVAAVRLGVAEAIGAVAVIGTTITTTMHRAMAQ